MTIEEKLKQYIEGKHKNIKFFSESINMPYTTLRNILARGVSNSSSSNILMICKALNISADALGEGEIQVNYMTNSSSQKGIKIPVLGCVQAGIPVEAVEDIVDYEEITEELSSTGEFFGLKIKGDSMEPKISENDIVIVKKQNTLESGQVGIFVVNGGEATCKKLKQHEEGVSLISLNQAYEPMFFTHNDIVNKPVAVIGRVVELRAKF